MHTNYSFMKKNIIFICSLLLLGFYSCESTPVAKEEKTTNTTTPTVSDNQTDNPPPTPTLNYSLEGNRVGDFVIGSPITTTAKEKGYTIEKRSKMAEGEEEPYYIISGDGESLLQVEPSYNIETERYEDTIGEILVISKRYKMANGIGVGSTIEAFQGAYSDAKFWHSNIGQMFVMETSQLPVQFLLNEADFIQKDKEMGGESTVLKAADFKAGSKISGIRVF